MKKFGDTSSTLKTQRFKLKTKVDELREILSAVATKIEDLPEGRLKAYVFDDQISEQHLNALVGLCERCGIRDLEERCAERIKEVTSDNFVVWEQMLASLVSLRKRCLQFDTIKNVNENLIEELRGVLGFKLTKNQAIQILERLDGRRLSTFLSAWPTPYIRFEYKDQGQYLPFEQASPGQQASALLTVMLNQEAGPLIID